MQKDINRCRASGAMDMNRVIIGETSLCLKPANHFPSKTWMNEDLNRQVRGAFSLYFILFLILLSKLNFVTANRNTFQCAPAPNSWFWQWLCTVKWILKPKTEHLYCIIMKSWRCFTPMLKSSVLKYNPSVPYNEYCLNSYLNYATCPGRFIYSTATAINLILAI